MQSVLQDWVMNLPLRAQGTLLTGVRGCDTAPKVAGEADSPERALVAFLRWCIMNPADPRETAYRGAFFRSTLPQENWKPSRFGHYPQHWYAHLMHCYEVIAYCHPDSIIGAQALSVYTALVENLHLNVETKEQMLERLCEDRVKKGTVVS